MNMLGLSSSVRIALIQCHWKIFLFHYIQVLCQYRLCEADHAYLTYLMRCKAWTRSLESWDRGFEFHSTHGCLCRRLSVFVLFCVYVVDTRPMSISSVQIRLRNWRRGQGPAKGCRATDEWIPSRMRTDKLTESRLATTRYETFLPLIFYHQQYQQCEHVNLSCGCAMPLKETDTKRFTIFYLNLK
jgi:hypothetical protein